MRGLKTGFPRARLIPRKHTLPIFSPRATNAVRDKGVYRTTCSVLFSLYHKIWLLTMSVNEFLTL